MSKTYEDTIEDQVKYDSKFADNDPRRMVEYSQKVSTNKHLSNVNSDLTNQLLLMQDGKFEKNRDKIDNYRKEIMTKNELIRRNTEEYNRKQRAVDVLLIVFQFILFGVILGILNSIKILEFKIFMGLIVLGSIYTIYRSYYAYYPIIASENKEKLMAIGKELERQFSGYPNMPSRCPYECEDEEFPDITHGANRHLDTDYSHNKWLDGDYPEATWYNPDLYPESTNYRATPEEERMNKPGYEYGGINSDGATRYTCQWRKGKNAGGQIGNMGGKFRSTIPCAHYPGYKEVNREICISQPGQNGEKPTLICDEV